MNIGWARLDFKWDCVERDPGVYDWSATDTLFAEYNRRGIKILALLWGTPAWASSSGQRWGVPESAEAQQHWRAFVQAVTRRYRSITHWEVWNEPHNRSMWRGSAQQYVELLLKPAAQEIHATNPDNKVLAPSVTDTFSGGDAIIAAIGTYGAAAMVNIISQNHYSSTASLSALTQKWNGRFQKYDAAGMTGQRVWVTETGKGSNYGETEQGQYLLRALCLMDELPRIDNVFVYQLTDDGDTKGVLRSNGQPKWAYWALGGIYVPHCQTDGYPWN